MGGGDTQVSFHDSLMEGLLNFDLCWKEHLTGSFPKQANDDDLQA